MIPPGTLALTVYQRLHGSANSARGADRSPAPHRDTTTIAAVNAQFRRLQVEFAPTLCRARQAESAATNSRTQPIHAGGLPVPARRFNPVPPAPCAARGRDGRQYGGLD